MKDIKIKCEANGSGYWVALDKTDIRFENGEATLRRKPGTYYLAWWMIGKPGDTIKIEASVDGTSIGKVETKIPAGEEKAAGVLKLEVK